MCYFLNIAWLNLVCAGPFSYFLIEIKTRERHWLLECLFSLGEIFLYFYTMKKNIFYWFTGSILVCIRIGYLLKTRYKFLSKFEKNNILYYLGYWIILDSTRYNNNQQFTAIITHYSVFNLLFVPENHRRYLLAVLGI